MLTLPRTAARALLYLLVANPPACTSNATGPAAASHHAGLATGRLIGLAAAVLAALLLSGCGSTGSALPDDPSLTRVSDPRARRLLSEGRPEAAADIYSERAARASNEAERQDFLLTAAEILYDRGLGDAGYQRLQSVPSDLADIELSQRRDILVAKSHLFADEPEAALRALPEPDAIVAPLQRARVFETRALAYNALGDVDNELVARIDLDSQLSDPTIIERSQNGIWQLLANQPLSTLQQLTTNVRGDVYQGWIELALSQAAGSTEADQHSASIADWQKRFPEHPANPDFVNRLLADTEFAGFSIAGTEVDQIAVLLPLSARATETTSAAIRDGIIAAHAMARSRGATPEIRFYDIGENPAYARTAMQNAINEGADAIIGPLRKQAVASIVSLRQVPVPTIALNRIDDDALGGDSRNVIQFSLAPEDEAIAAAERAIALSYDKAVILQADDAVGTRSARAFQETMYRYGGDVLYTGVLPIGNYDFSTQIREALKITDSDARFRTLSNTIGKKLFFEPSIRNDVDVIFLAITSDQAQSVRPQLDFFHARAVPRLGTSRVASLDDDPRVNADLNSIYYTDVPWVLRESLDDDPLKQAIITNFPQAEGVYGKLYAFGADAFNLVSNLDEFAAGQHLPGFTGELSLTNEGRVHRQLDWAQYQKGKSVPVEAVETPPLPEIRSSVL
ncbi:MAG: hypothetical protein CSB44_02390 [Gammaproteobacteria bacterium]|nr:MAG: hypothetical protein CSB44_02390 [Gammaproteobacteria bacterium]PIE35486.1 MAG: hypothetical protein CSA54_05500 [Gammaproteobacteria bacterium]